MTFKGINRKCLVSHETSDSCTTITQSVCYTNFAIITSVPSSLRPTTHECMRLVTHLHFRSYDKDGGHTTRSAIVESPMLHADFTGLRFKEPELLLIKVLHCGNRHFPPFWLLWPWPELSNLLTFILTLGIYTAEGTK